MMTYPMHVAGLVRDLPICKVTEDFYIGAFIMFGDAELTVACARDLLKLAEELDYDYLLTAEEVTKTVQTGDDSDLILWAALMTLSLVTAAGVILTLNRKNKEHS